MVNTISNEKVGRIMEKLKNQTDFNIVCINWGEKNGMKPNKRQIDIAKKLADFGIDLIIGNHPYYVQPVSYVYSNKGNKVLVFWSLGLFVGDVDKSKNIRDNLRKRITTLINIYMNYDDKNKKILYSHFRDWLHRALVIKNHENARIIQRFCRMKMDEHNEKVAKEKLQNLFKNDVKHKLAHIMERASRIIGGKGEVVYKTLQDILYRNPYDKFINNLKFLGKINTLGC